MISRTAIAAWIARHRLALTLALALALRLLLWSQPLHQLANDEVEYVAVARDLIQGRGWQFYEHYHWLRAPLYPLFLAASLWLAGGDLHLAALPNIALSVATVYLSYRLALALAGRRAALLAALLTTLLWTLATFASLYMSETLFTFLFTWSLLCLVQKKTCAERPTPGADDRSISRRDLWRVAGAGALFGLATLTRSITLLFLPVVAIWLLIENKGQRTKNKEYWRTGLCSVLFVLCCALVIAPWTIRNERAYGHPILVETGLSYNLWAFNEPREDVDTIFRTLASIPNPAERNDYATAKGLARLREDPAILLRKLWPDWLSLWRVKPIEDRFIQESYYADVGLPLFAAALLFDDALYLLILLAAIAGLVLYRRRQAGDQRAEAGVQWSKWLIVAWIAYVVATVLLTHGEGRYRHFLFPVLIPYAAWALTRQGSGVWGQGSGARSQESGVRSQKSDLGERQTQNSALKTQNFPSPPHPLTPSPPHLVIAILWTLLLATVLTFYPWSWAAGNIARGWHTLTGDIDWAAGRRAEALRDYERAITVQETADGWLRLGGAAYVMGDRQRALSAYRAAVTIGPSYISAIIRLGDLLREIGDEAEARKAFVGSYTDAQRVADLAWRDLRPIPKAQLDVGDGLDFGYVGGVYQAEEQQGETARWTNGQGLLRLRDPGDQGAPVAALVRLRLAAPHPGDAPVRTQICAAGRCWALDVGPRWRTYALPFSGVRGETLIVEVDSDAFTAPDGRRLGVLIDSASITELGR